MLNDVFIEQLIKRKPTVSTLVLKVLIWIAAAIIILPMCLSSLAPVLVPVALIAAIIAARILFRQLHLEFEYALTNNELEVAVIVGQKKRRELVALSASEIEFMAPVCDAYQSEFKNQGVATTYNAVSSDHADNRWFVVFRQNGKLLRLIFEPNDKLLEGLKRYNPAVIHGTTEG